MQPQRGLNPTLRATHSGGVEARVLTRTRKIQDLRLENSESVREPGSRPYNDAFATKRAEKGNPELSPIMSLEFLTDRQDAVVEEARLIQTPTLESFIFNFFACRCRLVERDSSSRRAGERYPVSQPCFAGWPSH